MRKRRRIEKKLRWTWDNEQLRMHGEEQPRQPRYSQQVKKVSLLVCKHCKRYIEPPDGFRELGHPADPRLEHLWKVHGIIHATRLSDHFEKCKPKPKLVATTLVGYAPSVPDYSGVQTEQGTKYVVQKRAKHQGGM